MPLWLIQVLVQFPIVVVIGFVAWYAYQEVRRANQKLLKQEADRRTEVVRQAQEAHQAILADRDRQIQQLEETVLKQLRAVERRLDALTKRFDGGEQK